MRIRDERGQVLFEFIVVFPLALLLLFGVIEAGWYFYNRIAVANASISGADYAVGVQVADPEQIKWCVRQAAGAIGLRPEDVKVKVVYQDGYPALAAVGIAHRYRPLISGILFRRPVTIRSESIRRYPPPLVDIGS